MDLANIGGLLRDVLLVKQSGGDGNAAHPRNGGEEGGGLLQRNTDATDRCNIYATIRCGGGLAPKRATCWMYWLFLYIFLEFAP